MRIDVKKFLFFGIPECMETFFSKAQKIGQIQFIDKSKRKVKDISASTQEVINAIKVLRSLPPLENEELDSITQGETLVKKVLELKNKIEKLEEEKRTTTLEISRIDAFGNFSLDDISYIEKETSQVIQFFFAKKGVLELSKLPKGVFFISSDHGLDYFLALNKESTQYDDMVEMRIEHELNTLNERLSEISVEINSTFTELKGYSKYNAFLHTYLEYVLDSENLDKAKDYVDIGMEGALFMVEGWIPEDKVTEVEQLVTDLDVQMVAIAIDEDQEAPTYLENEGLNKVGEDLVHIYDTPANTDRDPSIWVLFSFAVFFAMIIGDGGYGLIFLAGSLFMKYKSPNLKATGMRLWKLLMILCVSCVAWGVLTNSFFGVSFGPDNPIREYSVLNYLTEKKAAFHIEHQDSVYQEWTGKFPHLSTISDPQLFLRGAKKGDSFVMLDKLSDGILMEIALIVGIIHICISFIRYLDRSWAGIGWIIAIVGCFLYLPEFLHATTLLNYVFGLDKGLAAQEGWIMIWGGLGLAVGLSLIQNRLMGLLEITNVIQIFADILSYLRLYALGLAGGIISATVNELAGSMMFVFAVPLIIAGHSLNMVLSVIGGVIHGLRLNFIEWYHYSFEGGGKLFDPLRKLNIEN